MFLVSSIPAVALGYGLRVHQRIAAQAAPSSSLSGGLGVLSDLGISDLDSQEGFTDSHGARLRAYPTSDSTLDPRLSM